MESMDANKFMQLERGWKGGAAANQAQLKLNYRTETIYVKLLLPIFH